MGLMETHLFSFPCTALLSIEILKLVSVAGSEADRSINDLTQYPVYPWVISDYTSQSLG